MSFTKFTIKNSTTVFVLVFFILMFGAIAYFSMPRESTPDIPIPVVIVNTRYIGVSPADIETLITNPLEKKLKGLENIDKIQSVSGDSYSSIVIQFTTKANLNDAVRKVKDKVDQAKPDLPVDATAPDVIEINISDFPMMIINISSDCGPIKLKKIADKFKDQFEAIKGVLDVTITGAMEREIQVLPNPQKLAKYNISLDKISRTLQSENMNIPGGIVDIGRAKYMIRIPAEIKEVREIGNLVVANEGQTPVYIRDVAQVKDSFKDRTSYSRMDFQDSIAISIQKRSGENALEMAKEINQRIADLKTSLPPNTKINITVDQSTEIQSMVDELENSLMLGLILVCLSVFAFLGLTNALFISIAVPLSMFIGFITLHWGMGVTLNMVVLFSLILALGMLVDDSIVVVENIYRYLEQGYNRVDAAIKGTQEVAWSVFGATLTIVGAFFPLLFLPGIAGKFMKYLPIGVITTILASMFVALVVNPVIAANFMRLSSKHRKETGPKKEGRFMLFYEKVLTWAVSHRALTMGLVLLSFIFSIFIYVITSPGVEFFPEVTPKEIYVDLKTPESYTIEATNEVTSLIENRLKSNTNIRQIITTVGGTNGGGIFSKGSDNPNQAEIIAKFKDKKDQTEAPEKTIEWIRSILKDIPAIQVTIKKEGMGPPSGGAPISIQIAGPDYMQIAAYAGQIKEILSKIEGVVDISDDYVKAKPEIMIKVDREKANLLGVNSMMLASTVRTSVQGGKMTSYRDGIDEYDITLRLPKEERNNTQRLEELTMFNTQGHQMPLSELAKIKTTGGIGAIKHMDNKRVVTVEAKTSNGFYASERLGVIAKKLKTFPLEDNYSIKFVGENESQKEMGDSLKNAFLLALMLIFLVLIIEFNSVLLPFIIMSSIVLSLIGIMFGLAIFHKPFGIIMTGMGIISLAGVIVRNGIIIIQYIVHLREQGMDKYTAVIQAGKIRFRPVFLTAVTAILGLVPMTFGINFNFKHFFNNFWTNPFLNFWSSVELGSQSAEFWGSMGSAMTIGLTVGTILTLVVVPVLYISLDNWKEYLKRLFTKKG